VGRFSGKEVQVSGGSILTIGGSLGRGKYLYSCSVCSKDTVLWELSSKTIRTEQIHKSYPPCYCHGHKRYNSAQYMILVKRACIEKDYKLLQEPIKINNVKYRLKLYDNIREFEVELSVESLLSNTLKDNRRKDRYIQQDNNLLKHIIDIEAVGRLPKGTIFCRDLDSISPRGDYDKLLYKCVDCSADIYVEKGLCSGIFSSNMGLLKQGIVSCRCSEQFIWKQAQREYQLEVWMSSNESFVHWVGGIYKNAHSKFQWKCIHGNLNISTVNCFKSGKRCGCSNGGFDRSSPAILYLVKWYDEYNIYLKYGITGANTLPRRLREQARKNKLRYSVIAQSYYEVGGDAADTEEAIKFTLGRKGFCSKEVFPDGFTETAEYTEINLTYLKEIIGNAV
tara:strand:+ start:6265 stop:7446 length:1182 start_codon:yes stop_codon:yes gene_type:complete